MESLEHPEEQERPASGSDDQLDELREALRRPDTVIDGRYRVVGVLGSGGIGTTYEAEELASGRRVALKELSLRSMREWKTLDLFERESRVLASLDHPCIPRYLAHFQVDLPGDRAYYIVQELAPGKSLAQRVQEGWRCDEPAARELAGKVLNVLLYLQQLTPPVIHRDIKPQNIILRDDGTISLVDFGSVQDTYRNTMTQGSTVVGTYGYMAPEQFRGRAALASDLFGLAATLLYILTGRSPAELPQRKLRLSFRDKIRLSPDFTTWLERMLEPAPEDRFPTAQTALQGLQGPRLTGERMWPQLADLWRWDGTVDRGPYITLGAGLFALKYNLDRLVAVFGFHRKWSLLSYLDMQSGGSIAHLSGQDLAFSSILILMALPFIWTGVVMTLRRLRAVHLPSWLIVFFFTPVLNLFLFALLSVLPSREAEDHRSDELSGHVTAILDRIIPDHPLGSAAMAIFLLMPFSAGAVALSVGALGSYGWGLFVGLPFALGLGSVLLYGYHRERSLLSCLAVASMAVLLLGLLLLAAAFEGVICIMMAAPIGLALACIGGAMGYVIQRRHHRRDMPAALTAVLLTVPALMGAESMTPRQPPLFAVRTAIEVNAPPEKVWQHVVSFTQLPPPHSWLFKIGVAYPVRAEIHGHGVGAVRHCVFSTGPFIEPIKVWDEPRLLKFSVSAQPPPMDELSPYPLIHPPHLDEFLRSEGGQFLLTPLPGGRTRLEGTTWYRHNVWPAQYWRLWSDAIIHGIHRRVLDHVKHLAES